MKDKIIRVDVEFNKMIEEIKNNEALKNKNISSRKVTALIPKHNSCHRMTKEIIERLSKEI